MNITPTIDEIKAYKDSGKYDICPVSTEILSDFITPIEAMRVLKNVSTHTYMLESAFADEKWGRYTFLGYEPKLSISFFEGEANVNGETISTPNPSEYLRNLMSGYRSPKISKLPTFTGGLVGYFSFDYLYYSEPTAKRDVDDEEKFKDADLMLFDKVIAFDNVKQKIVLIVNIKLDDYETNYANAINELKNMADLLRNGEKFKEPKSRLLSEVKPLFDKQQYCDMVEKGKHYIKEGDIFQIVLSNRLSADYEGSLFDTYRVLRTINPSPYMFYFSGT
ncbi:MAG: chorismate-binding protein, partial [Lachnospiraceae bacterium]|nr:chorismate-binding protein [Lachnospiraceae bacterium]